MRGCAEATTPGVGDATTVGRIRVHHPNHPVRRLSAAPYDGHRSRPGPEPRLLSQSTRGRRDRNCGSRTYRLACQLGGTDDDNLIICNLPLFLSDTARAWLEHLPPGQISNWDDLVQAFASNFQGMYVRPGNSWDLRSCRQQPGESLWDYIRRFSKQRTELPNITDSDVIGAFLAGTTCHDLVGKLGRKTPTRASELMDIATKFASGQEAVEAIFRKDKQPQSRPPEDVPETSTQRGAKKKGKKKRKRNATPPTRILSLPPSTRTLGNLPEVPTSSTRCSRSRAPIIRGPSSTPLRSAPCFGATFTRLGHPRRVAGLATTTRRKITRQENSLRSATAS
jgi:hypothetical protein